ncbi:MaoC family dehydratase N-terminal domain-containing protein [Amycolatopsis sp. GM8]|uniref:FAS1-like dehydratase domain-containing protein n=1 Tax=Amycolatopsis sp. GM8 TaxID=2896530 RepID=UPI001F2E7E9A|nr:MaoC family dehydratase N-terminal domain-containing protein [Amycolatopsis sp. GM8]
MIDAIGTDLDEGAEVVGADEIELSAIRRYLEPLEFDCPLHYDDAVARAHGYPGVIAPYSGLATWTTQAISWLPGDPPVYVSDGRNDYPPLRSARLKRPGPDTNAGFATDVECEFHRPFVVGDRLRLEGRRLLSVLPKETSVGRGAFYTVEVTVLNQHDAVVATQTSTSYSYVARARHGKDSKDAG